MLGFHVYMAGYSGPGTENWWALLRFVNVVHNKHTLVYKFSYIFLNEAHFLE